jgi:hypothetical protein
MKKFGFQEGRELEKQLDIAKVRIAVLEEIMETFLQFVKTRMQNYNKHKTIV